MKKLLILLVILVAAFFRIGGIYPGYPPYHSDEGISYSSAVSMIKNKDLDPKRYDYPALVPFINYVAFNEVFLPIYWSKFYITNFGKILEGFIKIPFNKQMYSQYFQLEILGERESNALIWGRIVTAIFGVGVVYLTYLLGKRLFDFNVGIVASIFAAINYRLVLNSHLGLPDIYNSFFLLLSILLSLNMLKDSSKKNYLIAGIGLGLSLSIKFQVFAFLPFLFCHLLIAISGKSLRVNAASLINSKIFIAIFSSILLFFTLNPYLFIRFEEAFFQIQSVSLKYAAGKNTFDLFGLIYLYNIGLGRIVSILAIIGFILLAFYKRFIFLLFSSVLIPFLIVTNYLTIGGFYTRNYLTITPLLLIIAAFGISYITMLINRILKSKYFSYLFFTITFLLSLWIHLKNSLQVVKAYSEPWNFKIVENINNELIPEDEVVALHSSVPINPKQNRIPYELNSSFSLSEFREEGATYAVANLDWTNVDFYWWMTVGFKDHKYLEKPVDILEETYPALATREISDYAIFNIANPWQAPDSNFVGSVVPNYEILSKEPVKEYTFEESNDDWVKEGTLDSPSDRLSWVKEKSSGYLKISNVGGASKILHWESPRLNINNDEAFEIDALLKAEAPVNNLEKDGFIRVDFFKGEKRIATRLSSRMANPNKGESKTIIAISPKGSTSMAIGFQVYNMNLGNFYLDKVTIAKVKVQEDLHGAKIYPYHIPEDILFPNSHGGL